MGCEENRYRPKIGVGANSAGVEAEEGQVPLAGPPLESAEQCFVKANIWHLVYNKHDEACSADSIDLTTAVRIKFLLPQQWRRCSKGG